MNTVKIYFFHSDNDNGNHVELHSTREALASDIEECVRSYDEDRASRMAIHPFESDEWTAEWEAFLELESHDCNYFMYGEQDITLAPPAAIPRTWQPGQHDEMRVAVISTQHITREDGRQLLKADPRDLLASLYEFYESIGHIIHSDDDEPVEDAFPPDRYSDAFRALVLHFRALGYTYIRIDAHGPIVTGLPIFDW